MKKYKNNSKLKNKINKDIIKSKEIELDGKLVIEAKEIIESIRIRELEEEILLYKKEVDFLKKSLKIINEEVEVKLQEKDIIIAESKKQLENNLKILEDSQREQIMLFNKIRIEEEKNLKLKKRYENINNKYNSLSNSKLGKLTIKYWQFKKRR